LYEREFIGVLCLTEIKLNYLNKLVC
jgi:hypothetical protein